MKQDLVKYLYKCYDSNTTLASIMSELSQLDSRTLDELIEVQNPKENETLENDSRKGI